MSGEERGSSDDPDREAILARRQRAIALTLMGLSITACTRALPCLSPVVEPEPEPDPRAEPANDDGDPAEDLLDDGIPPDTADEAPQGEP